MLGREFIYKTSNTKSKHYETVTLSAKIKIPVVRKKLKEIQKKKMRKKL